MGAKIGLLKNLIIDPFIIFLVCINLAYLHSTLFLNNKQLSTLPDISAISAMVSLSSIGFLT